MKVLFIANDTSIDGGSSQSLMNLIEALRGMGVQVVVLLPDRGKLKKSLEAKGFRCVVQRYYSWAVEKGQKMGVRFKIRMFVTKISSYYVAHFIKRERIEIVHSINSAVFIGALAAKRANVKHVWHIREFLYEDHGLWFDDETYAFKLLNGADKLICVSSAIFKKYENILNRGLLKVVYNGVPETKPSYPVFKEDEPINALIIGSIRRSKGQDQAIKAIKKLSDEGIKDIRLNIVGIGEDEGKFRKMVKDYGLEDKVIFLGFVEDTYSLRIKNDISLTCSRAEAFGRVTAEAMMAGNLVIGADTAGTAELVSDGVSGLLYTEGDVDSLVEKIKWVRSNRVEARKIAIEGSKIAHKKYTISRCAKEILAIYEEIIGLR